MDTIPKYYMMLGIGSYARSDINTISTNFTQGSLILPLPENIVDAHSISYAETPLGSLIGYLASGAQEVWNNSANSTDLFNKIGQKADALLANKGDAASTLGAAAGLSIAQNGLTGGAVAGASAVTGYAPNQFLTILLKGPQYKKIQFTWKLSPRNAGESRRLNAMINLLHNSASPAMSTDALLFKFPKIFQVAFMPNSQFLFKMKPAVLEDIVVDYTGAGAPAFFRSGSDGLNAPVQINIRMVFHELEFWLAGNYSNSNDPTDTHQLSDSFTDPLVSGINSILGKDSTPAVNPSTGSSESAPESNIP